MGNISFTQGIYNPSDSLLHKLDPRSKIIGTLLLIISVLSGSFFSFDVSFRGYFLISIFLFVEIAISKISFIGIIRKIRIYLSMGLILMFFNIFFMRNGLLLLDLKILKIYDTPVLISLNVMCQIFLLTIIVEIFTSTTSVNEIAEIFEYDEKFLMKSPFVLSGGEKKMLGLALAVCLEPEILLLDEPTGALDYNMTIKFMKIVEKMKKDGTTVLLVTHDENIVKQYSDYILKL